MPESPDATQGQPGGIGGLGSDTGLGGTGGVGGDGGVGGEGKRGVPGERGRVGPAGENDTLELAQLQRSTKANYHRLLALAIGVLAVSLFLGYLSQTRDAQTRHNQTQITRNQHDQAVVNWNACQRVVTTTTRINSFVRGMSEIERTNRFVNGAVRDARIRLYSGLVLVPPVCGPRP